MYVHTAKPCQLKLPKEMKNSLSKWGFKLSGLLLGFEYLVNNTHGIDVHNDTFCHFGML